jgi:uncharacterized repeat protein (TIGR02543 family)
MTIQNKIKRLLRLSLGVLAAGMAWHIAAQPAFYTYDPSGNPAAVSFSGAGIPSIVSQPLPELAQLDSQVSFSVVAGGGGLYYQWLSNGVAIAGATNDTLVLANLALTGTNLGNFSVMVSNAYGSIISTPAPLWTDINGNGIPDWWELYYFGNLNQRADGDYDGDGVDNLDEYLEGTNPTNPASFDPRLFVESAHGTVSVVPLQPYYLMGQFVTLTATPDPGQQFTGWSGSATGTKPQITVLMDTNQSITANFGLPLGVALDNTNLLWSTGGDALWFGQTEVSEDGVASAQSGPIVSYFNGNTVVGQHTWLQTVADISQTMQLAFWWNVSSDPPATLSFAVDETELESISGEAVGWQNVQTTLPPGRHTLTWTYSKGPVDVPTGVPFTDSGWVDEVSLVPTNAAPPAPVLSIELTSSNTVLLSWPAPSVGYSLQQNFGLYATNWLSVTNPVGLIDSQNQVIIVPASNREFYRLIFQ